MVYFIKFMNYISLNIDLIFIFDGKPPENKSDTIEKETMTVSLSVKMQN